MFRSKTVPILILGFFIVMALMVTAFSLHPSRVLAAPQGEIGRYQISSWASYSGERVHHSGYYILDTMTGKVVDRGHEIHGIDSGPRP